MTTRFNPAHLSLTRAQPEEKGAVFQLLQLYLHDFSAFARFDDPYGVVGPDGLFEHDRFETYWTGDPARTAWLVRVDGTLAGFMLVNDWAPSARTTDHILAEFGILRKYRQNGIGRLAAHRLFETLPGSWELGVAAYNAPALAFWQKVITAPPLGDVEQLKGDGQRWDGAIFRFRSA